MATKKRTKPGTSGARGTKAGAKGKTKRPAPRAAKPKKVSWQPKGYPILSALTSVENCAAAIDWYKKVLGAKEKLRLDMPGGAVAHCELLFGGSMIMMGTPMPPDFPPKRVCVAIYVKDCDAVFQKAIENGARSIQAPADQFYGDRSGRFEDPFGNEWSVGTHIRDVTKRQMIAAMAKFCG